MERNYYIRDHIAAFKNALDSIKLTKIKGHYLYVENYMYMHSLNNYDTFKNIDTRENIRVEIKT